MSLMFPWKLMAAVVYSPGKPLLVPLTKWYASQAAARQALEGVTGWGYYPTETILFPTVWCDIIGAVTDSLDFWGGGPLDQGTVYATWAAGISDPQFAYYGPSYACVNQGLTVYMVAVGLAWGQKEGPPGYPYSQRDVDACQAFSDSYSAINPSTFAAYYFFQRLPYA